MSSVDTDLLEYLRERHTRESKAVKGRELSVLFNLTDKQVRNVVAGLRQEGKPICSSSCGYWYSTDPEDIKKTLRRMESQIKNMILSIKGLNSALKQE